MFFSGFSDYTLINSRPVDFDLNYFDASPVVGMHPIYGNIFMATGFNGRGATYGPAVGRGIAELVLDDGYQTIDFSRYSPNIHLASLVSKENALIVFSIT